MYLVPKKHVCSYKYSSSTNFTISAIFNGKKKHFTYLTFTVGQIHLVQQKAEYVRHYVGCSSFCALLICCCCYLIKGHMEDLLLHEEHLLKNETHFQTTLMKIR